MQGKPILVTGATGYVGGRLVPKLLQAGYRVRAAGRSVAKMRCRPWGRHPGVELVTADLLDRESMNQAAMGCWAAYYLVHSMNSRTRDFAATDRKAAQNMANAAARSNLNRIIYLGGIVPPGDNISKHLASRAEVGRILQSGPVPTTFLRAAMILGSGSASFELLRYLADRLPVMITPRWVSTMVQPIAITNVLNYLMGCLETDQVLGLSLDIGGPEITTYADLFQLYARLAGLPKRLIIKTSFLSPKLSSYWINLITPVPASLARPLAQGLSNQVIVEDNRIARMIPQELLTCEQTIQLALERIEQQKVETCWLDAGQVLPPEWIQCGDAPYAGGTILATAAKISLKCPVEKAWRAVSSLGGDRGWQYMQSLWKLRGLMDKLVGGVGLDRGRRDPKELNTGDHLDFWRVLEADPPNRLVLIGEMKLPGEAVLEYRVTPQDKNVCELEVIARFLPRGLWGLAYWRIHTMAHDRLYRGMLTNLALRSGIEILNPAQTIKPGPPQACRL